MSLVHQQSMPDVAQEAMEALLCLHQPDIIERWNPEAPINTFWDVRYTSILSLSDPRLSLKRPAISMITVGCRNVFPAPKGTVWALLLLRIDSLRFLTGCRKT